MLGFALGEHHDAELAYGALAMAVAVRGGAVPGVIIHTDQGSEYTAGLFRAACERLGIRQSMGRPGSALDNAVIESWHSTVEFELRRSGALRDQGGRAGRGRGLDRGLQPPPPALRTGQGQPGGLRAVAGGKGRSVKAAGRCAAQTQKETASPPLTFTIGLPRPGRGTRRARVRGRPSGLQAAAHRCAAACGPAWTPETSAAPQAGNTGRPSLPLPGGRGASGDHRAPAYQRTPGNEVNWRSIVTRSGRH